MEKKVEVPFEQEELNKVRKDRLAKLEEMKKAGINPYANNFTPQHRAMDVKKENEPFSEEEFEKREHIKYSVAGRVMSINSFGRAAFIRIYDESGKLQVYVRKNILGAENYQKFKKFLDIGDIVGVRGPVFKTKTGEVTILAEEFYFLTKSIRPLPEKYHGLKDIEQRYRQRYVDLIMNPEVREIFKKRSQIIRYIRNFFDSRGYIEVETPMMHPIPGGAKAKPFKTFHNALKIPLYLRIAPELYLKRLLVGGFERVYEINRNFRNEGIDKNHNPEFTMIEFYQAYATYHDFMNLTEELISNLVREIHGTYKISYQGVEIDFTPPWKRIGITEGLVELGGLSKSDVEDPEFLKKLLREHDEEVDDKMTLGELQTLSFEVLCEDKLVNPTFVKDFSVDVSPLSRRNEENPQIVDRFELYINGMEVANAFSELNDPIDQKMRFLRQLKSGSEETSDVKTIDHDYIRALEYGMPPAAGEGIGIDRLVMLLTDAATIKEVILFPLLKPEK